MNTVLFDMDGTLLDTERYYNICWPAALKEFGYEMSREEALELRSLGRPHVYSFFEKKFGPDFPYAEIRGRRKELMEEVLGREGIRLKPGAKELLEDLRKRGIKCYIVTATDLERSERYLRITGIREYFDGVISAVMVNEGKPSPDVYEYACREAGVRPEECYAVEDSPNGVISAFRAGCHVIMVPDLTEPDDKLKTMCTAVVHELSAVSECFADYEAG